jgi:hypothetical protein
MLTQRGLAGVTVRRQSTPKLSSVFLTAAPQGQQCDGRLAKISDVPQYAP